MLNFGFSIINDDNSLISKEIKNQYFIEELKFINKTKSGKNIKNINLQQCTQNNFKNPYNIENTDLIKNKKYLDYNCMQDSNYTLNGSFNDEIFTYFEYSIYLNWTSVTQEKMDFRKNYFSNNLIKIVLKYFDFSIDVDNFHNPIEAYESQVFDYIDFNFIKKHNIDFSINDFTNDNNIFIQDPENSIKISTLSYTENYSFQTLDRNPSLKDFQLLLKFYIRSSRIKTIFKRIYKKFPEMLAEISAIISNSLFLIILFNNFYNKFKSKEELINILLKFKENFNKDVSIYKKINDLNALNEERIYKNEHNNTNIFNKERFDKNKQNNLKNRIKTQEFFNKKNICLNDPINDPKNKSIEIGIIDIRKKKNFWFRFKNSFVKKKNINEDNFKKIEDSDIPRKEINHIEIPNIDFDLDQICNKNSSFINLENNLREMNKNSHLSIILKDENLIPDRNNSNNEIFNNFDIENIKVYNNNFNSTIKKNSIDDSISIVEYNKRIIHTDNNKSIKYTSNLIEIKELFSEENINMQDLKINNNIKKSFSRSSTFKHRSSIGGKSFKSKLNSINGNSLLFNFSFFEIISGSIFFCKKCSTQKYNLYEKAYKSINNHLDIYSYLKVIQELDTMKNSIFSIDENKIIDFISKPIISEDNKQEILIDEDLLKNKLL